MVAKKFALISVDLQNDFASEGGRLYSAKPSLLFLKDILFPYLDTADIKINEIISDYRLPRPGYSKGCCEPGDWGYESMIPANIKKSQWLKAMNSPVWTRENIGAAHLPPGLPYSDPARFTTWLAAVIGAPDAVIPVVFGLTVDCCVLCVVQELFWRGYEALVLKEGVDTPSGKPEDRDIVIQTTVSNWASPVEWQQLSVELDK